MEQPQDQPTLLSEKQNKAQELRAILNGTEIPTAYKIGHILNFYREPCSPLSGRSAQFRLVPLLDPRSGMFSLCRAEFAATLALPTRAVSA